MLIRLDLQEFRIQTIAFFIPTLKRDIFALPVFLFIYILAEVPVQ